MESSPLAYLNPVGWWCWWSDVGESGDEGSGTLGALETKGILALMSNGTMLACSGGDADGGSESSGTHRVLETQGILALRSIGTLLRKTRWGKREEKTNEGEEDKGRLGGEGGVRERNNGVKGVDKGQMIPSSFKSLKVCVSLFLSAAITITYTKD